MQVLGIIIGAYIVCWLPFFVLALVRHTLPQPDIDVPYWLDWLTLWLGWTNSLINPFVYAVNNRDFRTPFREILCCRWTTLQSVCRWGRWPRHAHTPLVQGTSVRRSVWGRGQRVGALQIVAEARRRGGCHAAVGKLPMIHVFTVVLKHGLAMSIQI